MAGGAVSAARLSSIGPFLSVVVSSVGAPRGARGCSRRLMPPSTGSETPVIQRAVREARKATTSAMSAPSAMPAERRLGDEGLGDTSGRASIGSISGVRTTPGRTALQRMPRGPSSSAAERTSASAPALAARVVREPGDRGGGVDRRDQRERAARPGCAGAHAWSDVEGAAEVDAQDELPLARVDLEQRRDARGAGRVDDRADACRARRRPRRRPRRPPRGRARRRSRPSGRRPTAAGRRPRSASPPRAGRRRRRARSRRRRRRRARRRSRPPRHASLEQVGELGERAPRRRRRRRRGGRASSSASASARPRARARAGRPARPSARRRGWRSRPG